MLKLWIIRLIMLRTEHREVYLYILACFRQILKTWLESPIYRHKLPFTVVIIATRSCVISQNVYSIITIIVNDCESSSNELQKKSSQPKKTHIINHCSRLLMLVRMAFERTWNSSVSSRASARVAQVKGRLTPSPPSSHSLNIFSHPLTASCAQGDGEMKHIIEPCWTPL